MDEYSNSRERDRGSARSERRSYRDRDDDRERSGRDRSGRRSRDRENGGRDRSRDQERTVIQIDGAHIGKVIGPAGRTINDMQRQYNVRIQISKRANSNGTKDAEITGSNMNDIKDAIKAIHEKVDQPYQRPGDYGRGGGRSYDRPRYERRDRERDRDRNGGGRDSYRERDRRNGSRSRERRARDY